jgi:hypothetical protein
MARQTERQIALILDRHLRGVDGFGVERLSGLTDVSRNTIHNHAGGVACPSAAALFLYVSAVGTEDPKRALALWRDLSALVGMDARPVAHPADAGSVIGGTLEVQAETGEIATAVARATHPSSPGGAAIVPEEIPAVLKEVRDAVNATCRLEASLSDPAPRVRSVQ